MALVQMLLNKFLIMLIAIMGVACKAELPDSVPEPITAQVSALSALDEAYKRKLSDVWVEGEGTVSKLLKDDNKGSRHQKFLVKIASGKTLLFAHNVDLAPRLDMLAVGDVVTFRGEYVYNPKGGVVHWTHKDPQGLHAGGWIKYKGNTYQ
jgi:hypothetical protein